jgi:hypothetical protein
MIVTTRDCWTFIVGFHLDIYSPTFIRLFFISIVWICGFFILNMTIATMLLKYDDADQEADSAPDQFEAELKKIGQRVFGEYHAVADFIIAQNNVDISPLAKKYMRKERSFLQKFFSKTEYHLEDKNSSYYQASIVKFCMSIIQHPFFDSSIMIVIILNTVCLALDSYPAFDKSILDTLSVINLVFTAIFTIEALLKMIALGFNEYIKEGFNKFDLFIVVTSLA